MKVEDVHNVTVIGAGLMGHGIAQVFAQSGYTVTMRDIKQEFLTIALDRMRRNLEKIASAGLIQRSSIDQTLFRIKTTLDMKEAMENADFVVEAATENLDLKKQIFQEASKFGPVDAILASNTSGLPIADLASATNKPNRVIGTHFWNPPYLLRAVEIVKANDTSDETVQVTHQLLTKVGKKPVVVKRDVPGQIGIRILYAMLREAISLVENGIATPGDIDMVVKEALGTRLPVVGVLELADLSGVDLVLTVSKRLFQDLDRSSEPSSFLQKMVAEGRTGIKSGKGFYDWTPESIASVVRKRDEHLLKILKQEY